MIRVLACLAVCLWAIPAYGQDVPRLIATAVAGAPLQVAWTLAWDASPDPSVTGYNAYCGPSSGSYNAPVTVTGTSYPVPFTSTFYCRVASLAGTVEGPRSIELGIVNNVPVPPPPQPPPPIPPPPPTTTSPDGTRVPPETSITAGDGSVFTFGAQVTGYPAGVRFIHRNGVNTNGWGSSLVAFQGRVYTVGGDNNCHVYNGGWSYYGPGTQAPCAMSAPPPPPTQPPPAPTSWRCFVAQAPRTYADGDWQYTIRCESNTPALVRGDGITVSR